MILGGYSLRKLEKFRKIHYKPIVFWWNRTYGIPEHVFLGYNFYMSGKSKIWILRKFDDLPKLPFECLGMVIMKRIKPGVWKPTTNAIQIFGKYATKNFIELNKEEAKAFMAGEVIRREFNVKKNGYVIVKFNGIPLGCGLYVNGILYSQIPKNRRIRVWKPS